MSKNKNKKNRHTKIDSSVRQGCVFSLDLLHIYMLMKWETLLGFNIGGRNLNNIWHCVDGRVGKETKGSPRKGVRKKRGKCNKL